MAEWSYSADGVPGKPFGVSYRQEPRPCAELVSELSVVQPSIARDHQQDALRIGGNEQGLGDLAGLHLESVRCFLDRRMVPVERNDARRGGMLT